MPFVPASVPGAGVADSVAAGASFTAGGVTSTASEHPNAMQGRNRKHIKDCRMVNSVVELLLNYGFERTGA